MNKLDQKGSADLVVALIVTVFLLMCSLGFGFWAYSSQQNYKNNTDAIVAKEVKIAVDKNSTAKDNEFAEQLKSPVKTYNGPSTYGSVVLKYPKTWSAYIDTSSQSSDPVDGYFNPDIVPGIQSGSTYALRLQVTNHGYDQELQQYDNSVRRGLVSVRPFSFQSVKSVVGVMISGQIDQNTQGTLILVPLRDKAIKLWTETDQFQNDFNKYVLPDFKFSP